MGTTSSVSGARFEVLRDSPDGRPCFRIDKYTGEVWKLSYGLKVRANYYVCEKDPSEFDADLPDKINYQLIVDGFCHAFLVNLNTGEMWEYWEGLTDKVSRFVLMKEISR